MGDRDDTEDVSRVKEPTLPSGPSTSCTWRRGRGTGSHRHNGQHPARGSLGSAGSAGSLARLPLPTQAQH